MVNLANTNIYGLIESIIASGYPLKEQPYEHEEYLALIRRLKHPGKDIKKSEHYKRACRLGRLSGGHNNFLKGILVQTDITYPQYFTPQLQRYNWIDIISSHSKMHTLTKNKDIGNTCNKYVWPEIIERINYTISVYNELRDDKHNHRFQLFMEIISNLPMGYELTMRVSTNYLQLLNIWKQRHQHLLKEDWGIFTDWITSLPNFTELTGVEL